MRIRLRLSRDAREALLFLGGMGGIAYMMILGPIHPELIPVFSGMMLYTPAAIGDRKRRSSTSRTTDPSDPSEGDEQLEGA